MKVWKVEHGQCKKSTKEGVRQASCCAPLGNSFPLLVFLSFSILSARNIGMDQIRVPNFSHLCSTCLSLLWQDHLLFNVLFSKLTHFKEETWCCCGTRAPWQRVITLAQCTQAQCLVMVSSEVSVSAWKRRLLGLISSMCYLYTNRESNTMCPPSSGPVMKTLQARMPWAVQYGVGSPSSACR